MIEDILKVGVGLAREDWLFPSEKGVEHVTQRSDRTTQEKQFLLDPEDLLQGFGLKIGKDLVFQRVHPIRHRIQQWQVVIYNPINQEIGQQSGASFRQIGPATPQTLGRFNGANRLAVHRDQVVLSQKDTELPKLQASRLV